MEVRCRVKETVVAKLTGGLAGMAKRRKVAVVEGLAAFTSPHIGST